MTRFTAALLAFSISCLFGAASAGGVELSEAERRYVQDVGAVPYCVDPDWPPYEIINEQGVHQGIAGDLLRLAASRVGLKLELVKTRDWEESLAASRSGRCQMLSFLNQTPKRDEWLIFTDTLFVDTNVIITREDHAFIADLAGISNETLVLPSGTSIEERVRHDYPNLHILLTDSEAEAFAAVSRKKADMTLRSMTVAVYTIKKDGWFNLKISGQIPDYANKLRVGVLKDNVVLRDVLNKGIGLISPGERAKIANSHVAINVQTAVDYELIMKIVVVFSVIMLTSLFWILKLRTLNQRLRVLSRTDILTGLANRASLDERFLKEIERASRYSRPFSVLMIDLDHFKKVNDDLGHVMGDVILKEFAVIAKDNTRNIDAVGRWGGEEFLVLCPETGAEQAMILARRIRDAVRERAFESGRRHTVSVGVAVFANDDTVDTLLIRADEALYQAKNEGRDRVCQR